MKCCLCDDVITYHELPRWGRGCGVCSKCQKELSIKKYKKSDIIEYKSTDDIRFITAAITLEDLFT